MFLYLLLACFLIFLLIAPQIYVESLYKKHNHESNSLPGTGEQLLKHLLEEFQMKDVKIEKSSSSNHYSPEEKRIYLKEDLFDKKSLTSVAIAAHEFSHALQEKRGEKLFRFLKFLMKLSGITSRIA